MGQKLQEVEIMTPELAKAFSDLERHLAEQDKRQEAHTEKLSEAFHAHEIKDKEVHTKVESHLEQHAASAVSRDTRRYVMWAGWFAILAALAGAWYSNHLDQKGHRAALEEIKIELKK